MTQPTQVPVAPTPLPLAQFQAAEAPVFTPTTAPIVVWSPLDAVLWGLELEPAHA
jgi:hypothetical protein